MFRHETGRDITKKEYETIIEPFLNICYEHLEKEEIPNFVSFYIATGYKRSSIWEASFDIHVGSALDMFNIDCNDYTTIKAEVTKILYNKYRLRITSEDPLNFEEVS